MSAFALSVFCLCNTELSSHQKKKTFRNVSFRRKKPHKDQLYSSQEFSIWVKGSQRLTWKAAKYGPQRGFQIVAVLHCHADWFLLRSPWPAVPPIKLSSMDKPLGTQSSSSKKIFVLEDRLKKIIYFVKYYHTSANIQSPRLDDLMHIFVKVLALLWDSNCSKTVIYAIYKKFFGRDPVQASHGEIILNII